MYFCENCGMRFEIAERVLLEVETEDDVELYNCCSDSCAESLAEDLSLD